jgi:electron transfer flavoprotein beta subunit
LDIIVCVKVVPASTEVRINPETNTLMREEMELIINPFDLYAIEEGLRLREAHGGTVTVVTMGPPKAEAQLREALGMGCDAALLLSARAFAGADTWATAYTLAQGIRKLGRYDLVLCGRQAIDGDTGQVGPGIAQQLGLPQLAYVCKVREVVPPASDGDHQPLAGTNGSRPEIGSSGRVLVERLLEEGREVVETRLPALLTVVKDINVPRSPTPRGLRRASRAEITVWGPADLPDVDETALGLDGSPTRVIRIATPDARAGTVQMMAGESVEAQAAALADLVIADGVV